MIKGLSCIFKGHTFEYATYKNPFQSKTPPLIAINFYGSIDIKPPISIGFMHFGLISNCVSCGKEADAEDMKLPILQPNFK